MGRDIDASSFESQLRLAKPLYNSFIGKPFKVIHNDPDSRELAIAKTKDAQELYSLKSRCFLESTGIYHSHLLCFLRDKGLDCSVINPNKICNIIFAMLWDNKPFEIIPPEVHCKQYTLNHPANAGEAA